MGKSALSPVLIKKGTLALRIGRRKEYRVCVVVVVVECRHGPAKKEKMVTTLLIDFENFVVIALGYENTDDDMIGGK